MGGTCREQHTGSEPVGVEAIVLGKRGSRLRREANQLKSFLLTSGRSIDEKSNDDLGGRRYGC